MLLEKTAVRPMMTPISAPMAAAYARTGTTSAAAFCVNRFHAQLTASPMLNAYCGAAPKPDWAG